MCCSLRLASVSVEANMSVLLGINSSLFMQSIKLHSLKEDIWFIVVKYFISCTVFNITVISFLSMVSVEWMVPLLSLTNSYFQCLYSLRGLCLRPHHSDWIVNHTSTFYAWKVSQKDLKYKKYQLTNSELKQHLFVKHDRFHSPTLTNPISTHIENARSVNLQGHLIHHIPWSCSKIFDQGGYSIIFLFLEIHRRKLLFLHRKKWVMTGVRRGGDVWQTHFASASFADNMNTLQALYPVI